MKKKLEQNASVLALFFTCFIILLHNTFSFTEL